MRILFNIKADKVGNATSGNLAGLDEDGNPTDSGIAASGVATTSDLAGKQDVISDLATIRSGAAAGATAYQKPSGGIPKTDLASGVQTSLGKADTAFQKPSGGITASDLATAVQTSLGKADTAVQTETDPDMGEVMEAVKRMLANSTESLSDEDALNVAALFPTWASKMGQAVNTGERYWYDGKLWKVIQMHTVQEDWTPDTAVSLFVEVSIEEWPQ